MIPEAELVRNEFIIRQLDMPPSIGLTKKSLLRWVALSLGLISKNESRDKGFLVLDALFYFLFTKKQEPTTLDIGGRIKEKNKIDMSEKLIRYHLNRIISLGIIQRSGLKYKINPAPSSEKRNSIKESFEYWFAKELEKQSREIAVVLEKMQKSYEK